MKIAVTGSSGFVGRYMVKRLSDAGHDLNLLVHTKNPAETDNKNITIYNGSVSDLNSLESAFTGCEIVFHLVGIIAETHTKTFQKTVTEGTVNVIKAAEKVGVSKIVYISAIGTSSDSKTKYHQTKYLAEQAIINSQLDYLILRPSVIYGQGDGFVSMLRSMLKLSPLTPVIGTGKYLFQPVYIDDLTQSALNALTTETAWNKIIDIVGAERLEYLEILNIIKTVLKIKRPNFYMPILVMKSIGSVLEKIIKPAPITKDQMIMLEEGSVGDFKDMKEILKTDPIGFEQGLRKYME